MRLRHPPDKLYEANLLAEEIAANAPLAVHASKRAINASVD